MVRFQGIFHNIGQGLFYSGTIKSDGKEFNFVYDCGTTSHNRERLISSAIERIANYTQKLNLLVISHFHSDHINGLDILLEKYKCEEIDTVIIPYFTPLERLLYALSNPYQEEWYYNFLADPVGYLLIDHNIKKIFLIIQNGKNNDNNDSSNNNNKSHPQDTSSERNFDLDDQLSEVSKNELPEEYSKEYSEKYFIDQEKKISPKQISPKQTKGYLQLKQLNKKEDILWSFAFYNYKVESEKLEEAFEKCGLKTKTIEDIKNIIKNKNGRNEIKQCYEPLSKDLFKDFNNTSLIMYHTPFCKSFKSPYKRDFEVYPFCNCNQQFFGDYSYYPRGFYQMDQNCEKISYSTFLTGDINLNSNYGDIKKHFNKNNMNMEKIAICLVPHHGSKNNCNEKIIGDLPYCNFFPISAGIGNKYQQPNYNLIDKIREEKRFPIWCNEYNYFTYRITFLD